MLDKLLAALQDTTVIAAISNKIDRALNTYKTESVEIKSYRDFNHQVAQLIIYLHNDGLLAPMTISPRSAMAEGVDLLEHVYENNGIRGYDGAYLDAIDGRGQGFEGVCLQLSEIIKEREITRYVNCRFFQIIDPSDKDLHQEIVDELIRKYAAIFPEDIRTGHSARFIKYHRDLLEMIINSNLAFEQIRNPSRKTPSD